ncbi:polysaccharide deacetylase family protein [Hymenobacter sp. 5317J-9]|uniref:polysaccharide deacetylase family protein n=1 Tax=Hymenobacter sp. 5317J-9 TaxID=2932250 RepID=UPI001FD66762|nr:polysaccharide deacetylase family protein [Hymenobacter sp. 5317J-9]UOQ96822.1 polysaccharide deacetylase family protein [Hymenobacter sp. 5317J-9]
MASSAGFRLVLLLALLGPGAAGCAAAQVLRRPVPDKLVVLTFDDAAVSHATYVAPLLKQYGFGGTFFVCEFREPPFADKTKYMTWAQIQGLHRQGFEVASHTLTHQHVNKMSRAQLGAELDSIEARCRTWGIPRPTTFAYPGYDTHPTATALLPERGYAFARAGGARAYDPATDHPMLLPSFSISGPDTARVLSAIRQAHDGRVVILTVHGVPDVAHDWVTTPPALFDAYLKYLHDHHYRVIALRDLARFVNVPEALRTLPPRYKHLK